MAPTWLPLASRSPTPRPPSMGASVYQYCTTFKRTNSFPQEQLCSRARARLPPCEQVPIHTQKKGKCQRAPKTTRSLRSYTTGIDASISAIVLDTRQYSRRMDWCSAATCKCSRRQYTHVRLVPSLLPSSTWCRTTKMTTGADLAHLVCRILSQHPRARAVRWHYTQPHRTLT